MNRAKLDTLDRTTFVNRLSNNVHDTTEGGGTDGNQNGRTSIDNLLATNETLSTVHSNGSDRVLSQMRRDLEDKATTMEILHLQGVENGRQVISVKLNVDDSTDDGFHRPDGTLGLGSVRTN